MNMQRGAVIALLLVFGLGGCVEQLGDIRSAFAPAPALTKVSAGSVRAANVALASVEGAPDAVAAEFSAQFNAAAARQDMTMTDAAKANYLVRGYLSAYPVEGGTAIAYVWDIFDAGKHRTQRVSDAIVVKSTPADPWSLADGAVLASLADKSVNDLAVFLTGTPEVRSAAATGKPGVPLAYAPVE